MSPSPKVPNLPSTGEQPNFEILIIRGVPHRLEKIRELESSIGGRVVTDEIMLANLDLIRFGHIKKTGKSPDMVEDEHTHEKFMVVTCQIPNLPYGHLAPQFTTNLYFKLKGLFVPPEVKK